MDLDVLILSSLFDFSTDLVCGHLHELGVNYLRINRETLSDSRIRLDPARAVMEYRLQGRTWKVSSRLKSVWYRQPVFLRNTPGSPMSVEEQLDRSQWSAFIRGLTLFDRATWVNHPKATYLAESKPYQLRYAAGLGFKIPETLITNDHEALLESRIGEPFVVKSVDTVLLREGGDELFAYSSVVATKDCMDPDFAAIPATCQELLRPKTDLRITVIGRTLYSVAVTALGEQIDGDWRLTPRDKLRYEDHPLSPDERRRCFDLVAGLGLTFGAIDMAVTPAGMYFIEINPTGEWGWLESPSRPITSQIAQLLAQPPTK